MPTLKAAESSEDTDSDDETNEMVKVGKKIGPLSAPLSPTSGTSTSSMSSRIDKFLSVFGQFSSQTLYSDRGIKLMQYTLWLVSKIFILDTNDPLSNHVSSSISNLQRDLSTCRYILRFYGMPQSLQAVLRPQLWAGECGNQSWKDTRIYQLARVMALSMFIYHPLEHVAWLKDKVEIDNHVVDHPRTGAKTNVSLRLWPKSISGGSFSVWSCRAWMVYIVAEWRCCWLKNKELRERMIQREKLDETKSSSTNQTQLETETQLSQLQKSLRLNRLQMLRCALFTVPCIQWSMFNPILSDNIIGSLTLAEAITCMYQSICSLLEP